MRAWADRRSRGRARDGAIDAYPRDPAVPGVAVDGRARRARLSRWDHDRVDDGPWT
ncbi:MAG: hypothetical protein ACLGIJ_03605 [Candidatus Limnocylindria bacterium]